VFGGVVGARQCEGSTVPARGEAVNVDVSHIEGKSDWEVVRRAVGSEAGRVSYLTAGGPAGTETVLSSTERESALARGFTSSKAWQGRSGFLRSTW